MTDTLEAPDADLAPSASTGTHPERKTPAAMASPLELLVGAHGVAMAILVGGFALTELLRSLVVLAVTAGVLVRQRRAAESSLTGATLLVFGLAGLMAGLVIGIHHTMVSAGSPVSVSGLTMIVSGLPLVAIGVRRLVKPLRSWRKLVALPIGVAVLVTLVLPLMLAMFVTNVPDYQLGEATPADFGLAYEDVTVTTSDGLDLAAWYIPSTNGAALVQLGGCCAARDDELESAAVLARHGYGVLMLDQRGHGGSEGDGMLWGWWGELDVAAGVNFVAARPDVDDGRIGAIGMSVGGEQVIAAAGVDHRIMAVVAEGVSARGARDEGSEAAGVGGVFTRYVDGFTKHAAALMTSADTPTQMRDAVAALDADQQIFAIVSGPASNEVDAARALTNVRPELLSTWTIPDAGHIEGLATHPQEWERRVIAFLDRAL